jgi:3',5'-cyclic AMP phosphodiesterase CpdA
MRVLATADLHFNHPRSRPLAEQCIAAMNAERADVLLVVGDTAIGDGQSLEECLGLFSFAGPRLFVPGNHELWTAGPDSYSLLSEDLPRRVRAIGWHWLPGAPYVSERCAIVGSLGWYDYSFAARSLGIPKRFYAAKVSPGAVEHLGGAYRELLERSDDVSPRAMQVVARWNDGKFIKLGRSDEQFFEEILGLLSADLASVSSAGEVLAAVHHLPFRALLPPERNAQWDFTKAYLGSARIGRLLQQHDNVRTVLCGHSHMPAEATVESIQAINIGSGYRFKTYRIVEMTGGEAGITAT